MLGTLVLKTGWAAVAAPVLDGPLSGTMSTTGAVASVSGLLLPRPPDGPGHPVGPAPRNRSISRRSRFVGRPAPRSRTGTWIATSRGGGGGLLSTKQSAATGGPTLFFTIFDTTTIRSRPACRSRTSSPTCNAWAGLARSPATFTCPARQAAAACERVFVSLTDQIQTSTRTLPSA